MHLQHNKGIQIHPEYHQQLNTVKEQPALSAITIVYAPAYMTCLFVPKTNKSGAKFGRHQVEVGWTPVHCLQAERETKLRY